MEKKAKWVYIGETNEFFTKSKFYPEIDRASTEFGIFSEEEFINTINDVYELERPLTEGYKFFIDGDGEPHLLDKEFWQINFYRL
ncbi:hypothetical protein PHRODO_146 [Bacillus phage Phrodo]|uniref:hypothetical protein n=1 Tax=Bacillus phage Phrodo TaxID=1805953 RepID=UPI0007A76F72|nr:hypothetical protein BI003_gp146 [Bacillus phage Phrodo]AMW62187.1 hypothetical protein PHRODO_146 [Bacillus phage Phrodo]